MGFSTWIVKKQTNWFQEPKDRTLPRPSTSYWAELRGLPLSAYWWPAIRNRSATDSTVHLPPGLSAPPYHGCPMSRLLLSSWMFRIMRETTRLLHDVNCSFWQNAFLSLLEKGKIMIIPFTVCLRHAKHSSQQCLHHLIQSSQPPKEVGLYCC